MNEETRIDFPLRDCPFCGGEAKLRSVATNNENRLWFVVCHNCTSPAVYPEREEAIAAWNRRADRWIPVSERLPEKEGNCIVTIQVEPSSHDESREYVSIVYFRESLEGFELLWNAHVTAWRPLPEPYKEEK